MNRKTLNTVAATLVLAGAGLYAGCQMQRPRAGTGAGQPLKDSVSDLTPRQQVGQHIFMRTCNQCHPGGGAGLGPSLNNKPLPSFAIKRQVREGGGAMPPFDEQQITDPQLTAVVDYLDRLRGHTRPQ